MTTRLNGNLKYIVMVFTMVGLVISGAFGIQRISSMEVGAHNHSTEAHAKQIGALEARITKLEDTMRDIKDWQDNKYEKLRDMAVDEIIKSNRETIEELTGKRIKP